MFHTPLGGGRCGSDRPAFLDERECHAVGPGPSWRCQPAVATVSHSLEVGMTERRNGLASVNLGATKEIALRLVAEGRYESVSEARRAGPASPGGRCQDRGAPRRVRRGGHGQRHRPGLRHGLVHRREPRHGMKRLVQAGRSLVGRMLRDREHREVHLDGLNRPLLHRSVEGMGGSSCDSIIKLPRIAVRHTGYKVTDNSLALAARYVFT